MTNRFFSPNQQFANDTGTPYPGGKLYFYASGTSTPQNTYSDSTLATPNANPVILDSAGRAGNVFLANLSYKVILKDLNDVQIWSADPVWSSDYSTVAQFQIYAGNPNGHVAGTAGTQGGLPSSVVFDSVNSLLYVCTTTGTNVTAVWTAINSPSTTQQVPIPAGRLTLTSGTPILAADVIAATAVYFTPYNGATCPIYNGTSFSITAYTELTMTLSASQAVGTIYDMFMFNDSGTATIGVGPAWTTSTAGAGARGTGAGTTQLTLLSGIWVNAVQITARNGGTTYTVAANTGTYLGSIHIDGVAGQVSCLLGFGQNRKWGVWNAYNRMNIRTQGGDATASWNYPTATIRASNAAPAAYAAASPNVGSGVACNSIQTFCGLPEESAILNTDQLAQQITNDATPGVKIGIGVNSTTVITGLGKGLILIAFSNKNDYWLRAKYVAPPSLGVNNYIMLEEGSGVNNTTFYGSNDKMLMTAEYRG